MKSFKTFLIENTITDNPQFKSWFKGSKVVDDQGNPLAVFHGTTDSFTEFNTDIIWVTSNPEYAEQYAYSDKRKNPNIMKLYASIKNPIDLGFRDSRTEVKLEDISSRLIDRLQDVHLPLEKAKTIYRSIKELKDPNTMKRVFEWIHIPEIINIIKQMGFDGVVLREGLRAEHTTFGAFNSNQIKSAIGNNGNFDADAGDITK